MNRIVSLFIRSLAWPFYKANALFFVILLYFAFGMLSAAEHAAIASFIAGETRFVLAICLIWSLYIFKTTLFIRQTLRTAAYRFMHQAGLLPVSKQATLFTALQITLNLPVAAYAVFIMYFQALQGELLNFFLLAVFLLVSVIIPGVYYYLVLRAPYSEKGVSGMNRWIDRNATKPYFSWFLIHSVRNRPGALFLTKVFSLLALSGFFAFYRTGDYDWRVLCLGTLFAFSGNFSLLFEHHKFESLDLAGFKNMPVKWFRRTIDPVFTWLIILLPEYALMARLFPSDQPFSRYATLVVWGLVWAVALFRGCSLTENQERLTKIYFAAFIFLFIYILYGFSMAAVTVFLAIAYAGVTVFYFRLIRD